MPFKSPDRLAGIHSPNQRGDALRISVTTARKDDFGDPAVLHRHADRFRTYASDRDVFDRFHCHILAI